MEPSVHPHPPRATTSFETRRKCLARSSEISTDSFVMSCCCSNLSGKARRSLQSTRRGKFGGYQLISTNNVSINSLYGIENKTLVALTSTIQKTVLQHVTTPCVWIWMTRIAFDQLLKLLLGLVPRGGRPQVSLLRYVWCLRCAQHSAALRSSSAPCFPMERMGFHGHGIIHSIPTPSPKLVIGKPWETNCGYDHEWIVVGPGPYLLLTILKHQPSYESLCSVPAIGVHCFVWLSAALRPGTPDCPRCVFNGDFVDRGRRSLGLLS